MGGENEAGEERPGGWKGGFGCCWWGFDGGDRAGWPGVEGPAVVGRMLRVELGKGDGGAGDAAGGSAWA